MKLDAAENAVAILTTAGAYAASVGADNETRVLAFCIIGSALGGLVAVSAGKESVNITVQQKRWRWIANFAAGIFVGPLLTDYAIANWWPDTPPAYVALAGGGAAGFGAVAVLCLVGPVFLKWVNDKLKTSSKLP